MDELAKNALSSIGCRKVESVASDRHPRRAIPARHRRTGDDGDADGDQEIWPNQEIYRNSQISDYLKISSLKRLGVKKSRVQIPAARLKEVREDGIAVAGRIRRWARDVNPRPTLCPSVDLSSHVAAS